MKKTYGVKGVADFQDVQFDCDIVESETIV